MQHLTEEQLVEHYYHDEDAPAAAGQHLRDCADCNAQYEELGRILALVSNAEVPERGESYGAEVWNRLRWKLPREKRRGYGWQAFVAAAAVLVMVFLAGRYFPRSADAPSTEIATATSGSTASSSSAAPSSTVASSTQPAASRNAVPNPSQTPATAAAAQDKLLFVVVSDHLDSSERMLLEVANADPQLGIGSGATARAQELVAENRIYRQTAARRGDARIASVLSDIEPILVELSNAGTTLSNEDLARLQKRIESRGLLFKVRVISAQVGEGEQPPARTVNRNTSNLM